MKTKKTVTLVLALVLIMSAVSSCGKDEMTDETKEIEAPITEIEKTVDEEKKIVENGKAIFTVIRAENAPQYEIDCAIELRKALEEKTGVKFKLETDWIQKNELPDMNTPEIVVGITNRTSEDTVNTLSMLDYTVGINGNKIELLAKTPTGLKAAVEKFLSDELLVTDGADTVSVKGEKFMGKAELMSGEIPEFEFGKLEGVYECSGSTVVVKAKETTEQDYNAYIELLHSAGFNDYAVNEIRGNLFATLTNDVTTVNCYYIKNTGITRVVSEPKGALFTRAEDNKYTDSGVPSLLTGMQGETVVASEGMGFIIRLCDGSFVIIDGGMGDPDSVDSNKLMNILNEQKPEGTEKPVIAAWLFTHLHGDHIGVFNCFSIDHHDDIVIESVYYNFPTEEQIDKSDSPYMNDDTIYRYTQFKKCMSEYYPDLPNIKLHTGNKFHVRNAEFEILSTLEDILPKTIVDGGMNESSICYKMTLDGQTTLWTGDIANNAVREMMDGFGDYVKSDILQLAHHGMNGTVEFYSAVDPTYAILPTSWNGTYESMKGNSQNQWVINSSNLKHLICTSFGTWTVKLPYEPSEGTYDKLPDWKTKYPKYPSLLGE